MRRVGRSERIRTSDPLLPKQVRYQAALHSAECGAYSVGAMRRKRFKLTSVAGQLPRQSLWCARFASDWGVAKW